MQAESLSDTAPAHPPRKAEVQNRSRPACSYPSGCYGGAWPWQGMQCCPHIYGFCHVFLSFSVIFRSFTSKMRLHISSCAGLWVTIKIVFSGGSANNIHLLVDAPREINVARNSAGKDKKPSPYYREKGISKTAQREIAEILMREKRNQSHVSGEETVTYKKR